MFSSGVSEKKKQGALTSIAYYLLQLLQAKWNALWLPAYQPILL
jgi:hypothetical protein